MDCQKVENIITTWLKERALLANQNGFVVGVSGGIDSAVVSTLCAKTGLSTCCLTMPIHQEGCQENRALEHITWLMDQHAKVSHENVDLTPVFDVNKKALPAYMRTDFVGANLRSRLRMATLYAFANGLNALVTGTGNKVEDFGIGFFTKYGDGGVDLSPIGDLTKTEVYLMAKHFGIVESIQKAKPTDGLWPDNRGDEDQIGNTYPELEKAMWLCESFGICTVAGYERVKKYVNLIETQEKTLYNYLCRHEKNTHKMELPPICRIEKVYKSL